jgi:hypothetical protein
MAELMLIFSTAKFSLMKIFPNSRCLKKLCPCNLNRGGSDSFFASRILILYAFFTAKNYLPTGRQEAENRTVQTK